MLVDLSILVTAAAGKKALESEHLAAFGHMGTHFDVMDKEFPLEFTRREGIVFNVSSSRGVDIGTDDIDIALIEPDAFVAFHSGFIDKIAYGSKEYLSTHPQLSNALLDVLLAKKVSIIGIDFAGVRRGAEHTPTDQRCADQGVFIVENLCNLGTIVHDEDSKKCIIYTYPIRFAGMTGLPCRVVADLA